MVMNWIYPGLLLVSLVCGLLTGNLGKLSAAAMEGAAGGIRLAITLAGPLCLWSGVQALMEEIGLTRRLSKLFSPLLCRLFPAAREDGVLLDSLSSNFTANLLGLGNAATPPGIESARRLKTRPEELCRLIVLNSSSIQLIPTTVASLRAGLGAAAPMDILLPVWISSLLSAAAGLAAARLFERLWKA